MSTQISAMKEQAVRIAAVFIDDGYVVFENGVVLAITGLNFWSATRSCCCFRTSWS